MKKVKGIELFTQVTKDFRHQGFDGFEVHPCKVYEEAEATLNKKQFVEQCKPAEAEFWSVYVHLVGAGLDCIADCKTEKEANELVEFLTALRTFYKGE